MADKERRHVLTVLGLINNGKGEYVLSQRFQPEIPEAHLKWDFVGGRNEFGESPEATIVREAKEETGLDVKVVSLFPKVVTRTWESDEHLLHCIVLCFECELIDGELDSDDPKINALKWVPFSDLSDYEYLPTTKIFVEMIFK